MRKAIPYYRVSTERQGVSGLGLDAQKAAVRQFAKASGVRLLRGYTEVETGKKANRPILERALAECRKQGAVLLIAKQDRLSRKVQFISALIASGVPYLALDNPSQNKFMAHVMAAWAEYEHDEISARTKAALAAAKRRGVKLGAFGSRVLSQRNRQQADDFARGMVAVIQKLREARVVSVRGIAEELNRRSVPTYTGRKGCWSKTTVHNLLKRLKKLNLHI
jgi:DNA invertase Pin-like site-specific DNA recombinase